MSTCGFRDIRASCACFQHRDMRIFQITDDLIEPLFLMQMMRKLTDDVLAAALAHRTADKIAACLRMKDAAPYSDIAVPGLRRRRKSDAPVRFWQADQSSPIQQMLDQHTLPHRDDKEPLGSFSRICRVYAQFLTARSQPVPERIRRFLPRCFDLMQIALSHQARSARRASRCTDHPR